MVPTETLILPVGCRPPPSTATLCVGAPSQNPSPQPRPAPVRQRTKSDPGNATPGLLPSHASPGRLLGSRLTAGSSRTTLGTPGSSPRHLGRSRGLTNQSGAKACEQRPLCRPAREGAKTAVARAVRPNLSGSSGGADTIPTLKVCPGPMPSPRSSTRLRFASATRGNPRSRTRPEATTAPTRDACASAQTRNRPPTSPPCAPAHHRKRRL